MKVILFTVIQFTLLGIILSTNDWFVGHYFLAAIQIGGISIGIWSIITMSGSKLNIAPNVLKGSQLITKGPYKILRHPMYLSLLLYLLPMLYVNYSLLNLMLFSGFVVNLYLKVNLEENLLKEAFEEYPLYMQKTWRIIPYIY
ncbi:MAG: hypothetical protein K9H49_01085 [Bacteroidales bacterium]|nr:hypothetical protein [Bacteroidales bacterium]MCF8403791.1 hypothetical protein [Bacteroidales bacterium]